MCTTIDILLGSYVANDEIKLECSCYNCTKEQKPNPSPVVKKDKINSDYILKGPCNRSGTLTF